MQGHYAGIAESHPVVPTGEGAVAEENIILNIRQHRGQIVDAAAAVLGKIIDKGIVDQLSGGFEPKQPAAEHYSAIVMDQVVVQHQVGVDHCQPAPKIDLVVADDAVGNLRRSVIDLDRAVSFRGGRNP